MGDQRPKRIMRATVRAVLGATRRAFASGIRAPAVAAASSSTRYKLAAAAGGVIAAGAFWDPSAVGMVQCDGMQNSAFVFIKPQSYTVQAIKAVREKLLAAGCEIVEEAAIAGDVIDEKRLIDQHYYAIASKAVLLDADQLPVPADKFREGFGEDWSAVVAEGRAVNAMKACERFGCTAAQLNEAFRAHEKKDKSSVVKLGGGFYCAKFAVGEHEPLYIFNAFYMSMRGQFVGPENQIYYFSVQWDPAHMSWSHFRNQLLGPTDPADAPATSIRGHFYSNYQSLGLTQVPDKSNNAVHASASPLEGLAEKSNWLGKKVEDEQFGRALLANGVSPETIKDWSVDPRLVVKKDGNKQSLWDAVEDSDADACLASLLVVNELN